MNTVYIALVTAAVMGIGQLTKATFEWKKVPRIFPLLMVLAGILMGIVLNFSLIGAFDGLIGGLSAMGFHSGVKHVGKEKQVDLV